MPSPCISGQRGTDRTQGARLSCLLEEFSSLTVSALCPGRQQLERLGKLYAAYKGAFPHMLWRETPPQHFLTPGGMFIKGIGLGKPPFICGPIANVTLQDDHSLRAEVPEQVGLCLVPFRLSSHCASRYLGSMGVATSPGRCAVLPVEATCSQLLLKSPHVPCLVCAACAPRRGCVAGGCGKRRLAERGCPPGAGAVPHAHGAGVERHCASLRVSQVRPGSMLC